MTPLTKQRARSLQRMLTAPVFSFLDHSTTTHSRHHATLMQDFSRAFRLAVSTVLSDCSQRAAQGFGMLSISFYAAFRSEAQARNAGHCAPHRLGCTPRELGTGHCRIGGISTQAGQEGEELKQLGQQQQQLRDVAGWQGGPKAECAKHPRTDQEGSHWTRGE